jgi:hypothetical protein
VRVEDLTNIVMNRIFRDDTRAAPTRPMLDFLADSICECMTQTAR